LPNHDVERRQAAVEMADAGMGNTPRPPRRYLAAADREIDIERFYVDGHRAERVVHVEKHAPPSTAWSQ
jgi:hypothetical protein